MTWWWWILPTVVGGLGVIVVLGGLGGLFRGKIFSGLLSTLFGGGVTAAAVIAVLIGLDVQTYARLTYERPVATIDLRQTGVQNFEATVTQPPVRDGEAGATGVYPLMGDEWRIEAQVLRWKPWANVLGLDTQYRLDRLSGRYTSAEQERAAARSVHPLSGGDGVVSASTGPLPWRIDAWNAARRYSRMIDAVDTLYGGATYMPMADGARYEVWITQSGLIARPANDVAREASAGGWAQAG